MESFAQSVLTAGPNKGPWEKYKFSPESRTVYPTKVFATEGVVQQADNLIGNNSNVAYLKGAGAAISLDFGFNTCGLYSVEFGPDSDPEQSVHLAFSETNKFVDKDNSDRSMDFLMVDKTIEVPVSEGVYTCPYAQQRGAFRYLTISTRKPGKVSIRKIYTKMNNMPSLGDNLRNYSGYFYSNDEFANTIWYAGAYTIQLSIIPTRSGRRMDVVTKPTGWSNDVISGFGQEVLVDGARRDRTVWSGDRTISQFTEFITFNSKAAELSTDWILDQQTEEGEFPYACNPIHIYGSDMYHLWTLKSIYDTFMLNDKSMTWLRNAWVQFKKGMERTWKQVDETGVLKIVGPLDWGRTPFVGHPMSINCVLHTTLIDGTKIADILDDPATKKLYAGRAEKLKKSINEFFWDDKVGAFKDSDENDIHSQDGNAIAMLFHVADKNKYASISKYLSTHWTKFGATAPEMQNSISPFISSLELQAHTDALGFATV
ncbi:hypothetical protein FOA43_002639 [Brettanomyces nanus]|uniref:Alpha-L-rhamnosidase six-hairpin glycosidase domain-containing protein n=1 Tax=Eeniella nana TaxID=13502 RepID=A0A875S2V7_EENNA|nr:uncharacterized protein FOA43_002639 [Brettanomyces nanus]QPG75288.1 hypothetical protein FOA43_002639 [Brettanomyces nanus]